MAARAHSSIVMVLAISFIALAALVWLDETMDLPHYLLGADKSHRSLEEISLEVGAVMLVGVVAVAWVHRMAKRLAFLENFIVLCAWCRRIRREDDEWLPLETFSRSMTPRRVMACALTAPRN